MPKPHPNAIPILNALKGLQDKGGYWSAYCPAHEDKVRSLSAREGTTKAGKLALSLHCFTGCSLDAVLAAIGYKRADLYLDAPRAPERVASSSSPLRGLEVTNRVVYEIRDVNETLVAKHIRLEYAQAPKNFKWERNGQPNLGGLPVVTLPLYGAHLLGLWQGSLYDNGDVWRWVFVTEGERAAEALWRRDLKAVGTVTGAGTVPLPASLEPLKHFGIICWPDNDDPGRAHMNMVAAQLVKLGGQVPLRVVWDEAPPKGDAADYPAEIDINDGWINRNCELWTGDAEAVVAAWEHTTPTLEGADPFDQFGAGLPF